MGETENREKVIETIRGIKEMARVTQKILGQYMETAEKLEEKIKSENVKEIKRIAGQLSLSEDDTRRLMSFTLRLYHGMLSTLNELEKLETRR